MAVTDVFLKMLKRQLAYLTGLFAIMLTLGYQHPHKGHQRQADEDAGAKARDEQLANRHFGAHAVKNHGNGGRDDDAQLGAGGLQRCCSQSKVAGEADAAIELLQLQAR